MLFLLGFIVSQGQCAFFCVIFDFPKYSDRSKLFCYFEDPNPAIQVQTLPLHGPVILRVLIFCCFWAEISTFSPM